MDDLELTGVADSVRWSVDAISFCNHFGLDRRPRRATDGIYKLAFAIHCQLTLRPQNNNPAL